MDRSLYARLQLFCFDLDGCIYNGEQLNACAADLLEMLRSDGKVIRFITNNSRQMGEEIASKLAGMGVRVSAAEVITATEYAGIYMMRQYGPSVVKVYGSESLRQAVVRAGHHVLDEHSGENRSFIVIGRDIAFSYEKLQRIALEVEQGAQVIGVNSDRYHPGEGGHRVPETGALTAAVEAVTGVAAVYAGKPAAHFFAYAMEDCGFAPEQSLMVGDNYSTDIIGGKSAGMHTVWLTLDQVLLEEDQRAYSQADIIVRNIAELYRGIEQMKVCE